MKLFQVAIWLSVISIVTSYVTSYNFLNEPDTQLQVNERAKPKTSSGAKPQTSSKFKQFLEDEQTKDGIGDALGSLGGIYTIATMDYDRPAKEVIKDFGDAVVPLIATALSFIPGGGSIVGGLVTGVWGIFSSILGSGNGKSPMQRMIENVMEDIKNIRKEMEEIKKQVDKAIKKTAAQIRKEIRANITSLINKAMQGEISRNRYVCNKYALISKQFTDDLRNNRTISEMFRTEMVGHLHNCDNFLKDTAEAFVYPEYADVLWVPSVITTMVRVAFLTEFISYGHSLKIDKAFLGMFFFELKKDIKQQFKFSGQGAKLRMSGMYDNYMTGRLSFTASEYQSCKLQGQLLYFDREMYPYGVPKYFRIYDKDTEIKISDLNVTRNDERKQIHVFYNELRKKNSENTESVFNCITGSAVESRMPTSEMSFRVTYVLNKGYEIRVLYFAKVNKFWAEPDAEAYKKYKIKFLGLSTVKIGSGTSNRKLVVSKERDNTILISIAAGSPSESSFQRFLVKTAYHKLICFVSSIGNEDIKNEKCSTALVIYNGNFVLESVLAFNVLKQEESKGKIVIKNLAKEDAIILGVELTVLPLI